MRQIRLPLLLLTLNLWLAPTLLAAQEVKIGVADLERAIVESVEGKKAYTTFTAKLEALRKNIETKQKQLEDAQTRLKTQERLLGEGPKAELTKDIDRRQVELTRLQEDAQKELDTMRSDLMRPIAQVAERVLDAFAKEQGYTLIIDSSNPQNGSLVFVNPKADITNELIKRIDAELVAAAKKP